MTSEEMKFLESDCKLALDWLQFGNAWDETRAKCALRCISKLKKILSNIPSEEELDHKSVEWSKEFVKYAGDRDVTNDDLGGEFGFFSGAISVLSELFK